MKKTLIALAVAASAAVSGSAMAWTANGTGGNVDLGGTLTPADFVTPWEVKVGDAVMGLNAPIKKGHTTAEISLSSAIPVLGIRTQSSDVFTAQTGITPQINYQNTVNVDGFNNGETTLTLDVTDSAKNKIGSMTASFSAAAIVSVTNLSSKGVSWDSAYASASGKAFFGGVGKAGSGVLNYDAAYSLINGLSPEFLANFNKHGVSSAGSEKYEYDFSSSKYNYSAAYGSGIKSGQTITITLDNAATGNDAIEWKASLPVTVTYA
ncbi:hypothetical protein QB863_003995 [Escherichia coli]|nr:hypothetical protein [Escherichia coli]